MPTLQATTADAYRLFHEGSLTLARMEHNGIRVDLDYLDKAIESTDAKVAELDVKLRKDPVYATWRRRFGAKANINSTTQLGEVLFGVMKLPCSEYTEKDGRPKCSDDVLRKLKHPFVDEWLLKQKYMKDSGTFLKGIRSHVCPTDGRLHPFYNLTGGGTDEDKSGPVSFRSASEAPNGQNFPSRDPRRAELVRTAFIPTDEDHEILESDFKAVEVGVAAIYTQDPVLIEYVTNPKRDMHRDMASRLFFLSGPEVTKALRHCVKNKYVFPQFYGSYWAQCAPQMWEYVEENGLTLADGGDLFAHLRENGIRKLGEPEDSNPGKGTFLLHTKEEEEWFWKTNFKVYDRWKREVWEDYQRTGEFQYLTGFVIRNQLDRKQVINYRIQGTAFHCLLWTLVEMDRWLRAKKFRSKIVGQIHDSMIMDVYKPERQDILAKLKRIISVQMPRAWPWINIPLSIEVEVSDKNWYSKKPIELVA